MRNEEGIRCIFDVLGEYARDEEQVEGHLRQCDAALDGIAENRLDASLTVKMTALGVLVSRERCREHVLGLCKRAFAKGIGFEMDMEGRGLVETTLDAAITCARNRYPLTLTLQAYLDRTPADLERITEHGIRVRLVKGAYLGDTDDPVEIVRRFRAIATSLRDLRVPFSLGTHDRELVGWILRHPAPCRERIEFGFLKGLADETKPALARQGWQVAEYVPFGMQSAAYRARRESYLSQLKEEGRWPVP
jgi:proline dehydrogenase